MKKEIQAEQEHLNKVIETISSQINRLEAETSQQKKEVVTIRRHFWDDLKVNMDTFDDYLETLIGLRQQAQALSVSQSSHRQASKKLSALSRMKNAPYFGRIDFTESGTMETDKMYIGISTLTDKSGENFLIYDWRAPISSVYYDYSPGPAEYSTPGGVIYGKLEEKWQYIIREGILESMFDTRITIGDEILQEVLGKGTDKHMHSIVATIQQEQNRIIRHDRKRLLIVQGAAGSGKTSAALQRVAYLLYKHRESLTADQIILFSPNSMFNSYVSNVLPELGEENMQQVTFQEYLEYRLSPFFEVESPYEQLEFLLTADRDSFYSIRSASIRFKASKSFFEAVQTYRQFLEGNGMIFKGIKYRGETLISDQMISERFYGRDTSQRFSNRITKLKEWLHKVLDETEKIELTKPWVQEEMELLSKDDYQKVYSRLEKKRGSDDSFDDYERETKMLARMIVRKKLKPLRKRVRALRFIDIKGIYKQFFEEKMQEKLWDGNEKPENWDEICYFTQKRLEEQKLYYEDAAPFLLLKELIEGFQTNTSIKHVLVDEGQDYSPFQFEFLKRLFPRAKMTVLGDFNQAIFAHSSELADFQTLADLYGTEETENIILNRSYRSTKQIIEFTRQLIPEGERIIAFEREGAKPVITEVSDHDALNRKILSKIEYLRSRYYKTIAIICKSATESLHVYNTLSKLTDLKLVKNGKNEYEQGLIVIPAYLAKGIEFDAVIIFDASAAVYGDDDLRRLFYTACTRAMHELHIYYVGEPSLFLCEVSPNHFQVQ
ncbi:RNA polymerase recycling motor HelD [Bacillus massiliglaciei]|uniref:RNA polymerase recycling motor HelD n=1 Tax=Bacillus massiliglaciei TaxID=1816693 RepID=UPI000B22612F|nr:RNA polymerase recycling motor HelD [Bacillus massiliglaciei]